MGATCCCLRDEFEDFANPNSSIYRNCTCLDCFFQNFVHMYASLFHGVEEHALSSSNPGATSLNPMVSLDNSLADMYRSPPRPLPYDADPRCFHLQQRDRLASRREKGSSHSHDESDPMRTSGVDEQSELLSNKNKWNEFACEEGSKDYNSRLSFKLSNSKIATGFAHIYASSEEEDVCPTCLEEYSTENPKIITECSHHYHLGCIYEWMERSDKCPVCGKVMAFNETT
ncbi:RING/U-box superfamily protein [Perilla frutescens var. frutescens]|nr:RING/U-box superfamily protein [Perilla frutescens var. frutescens]